ncbi:lytic polysaccharide monooxygenase [Trematosphaeria pertusa]|uniref:AA9 family lytic polysaccharide monooxygenase n=1 Tax=Trematosphaeria pertusa TaxID=390896 RepID=A0A6A6IHX3_9PLEO|nr:lytic polysaccharide monooxygenase [Trematosphaeria pertusa]KAF2249777.1 lytic polysaccharide monooxygenase [Trematosphaeria pertusa]
MIAPAVLLALTSLTETALAHGGIWNYSIAGNWQPGFFPYYPAEGQSSIQRHWIDFSPIKDVTSFALVCNSPGSIAEKYASIPAGGEVKAYYPGWPHDIGPIVVWMAYCGSEPTSCDSFNGTGKYWFKIQEVGLQSGTIRNGQWALKDLLASNYTWTTTIPETLRQGAYLMRHEIIALHVPFEPEFYPECAHLWVTGGGSEKPSEEYLASIPGVWRQDEPDLHMTIYEEPTSSRTEWKIPGPPVWRGS